MQGVPAALSRVLGVPVIADNPGIGENLQDHYAMRVVHRVTRPVTLNEQARPPRLWWEMARWLLTRRGMLAFSPAHAGAFARSRDTLGEPDLQFVFHPRLLFRRRRDGAPAGRAGHDHRRLAVPA